MFYIKEIIYRSQYCFVSLSLTTVICYTNKNILLFLLTQSVTFQSNESMLVVDHFIYTHPVELFTVQIFLIIYFSIILTSAIFFWGLIDFLKPSFILLEYQNFRKILILLSLTLILLNDVLCLKIFPNIWFFFQDFNSVRHDNQSFDFLLELRIYEYFSFLKNFIYLVNFYVGILVFCVFLFAVADFKILIYWKKLFIFLNMVFATLLSPPDVFTQVLIFLFLTFLFGSLIFICLLHAKFRKYLVLNKATY